MNGPAGERKGSKGGTTCYAAPKPQTPFENHLQEDLAADLPLKWPVAEQVPHPGARELEGVAAAGAAAEAEQRGRGDPRGVISPIERARGRRRDNVNPHDPASIHGGAVQAVDAVTRFEIDRQLLGGDKVEHRVVATAKV